jgi:hypothetical protein
MLSITHMGHSGWLCQAGDHTVLIDPLLEDTFGRGSQATRMSLWPPRRFSFENFPALDAVLISHEHEDHFNIPSLNMFDRAIPVYISSRSSLAATTILSEMGFDVRLLIPGQELRYGSLEFLPLSPDHLTQFNLDEWDVLAFLFRDGIDGGTFFTTVDVSCTEGMLYQINKRTPDQSGWVLAHTGDCTRWTPVSRLEKVLFEGEKVDYSKLNSFPMTADRNKLLQTGNPVKLLPGEKVSISGSEIVKYEETVPFLRVAPRADWGYRSAWRYHPKEGDFEPATGRFELSESEEEDLQTGLAALADFLYGSRTFRSLFSLSSGPELQFFPKFVLLLIADAKRNHFALEYDPTSCSFRSAVPDRPFKEYACGIECWATDLVATFRGDFEPRILSLGHSRYWCQNTSIPDPFVDIIWPFFHPLRRPGECLARYREQLRSIGAAKERIPSRMNRND